LLNYQPFQSELFAVHLAELRSSEQ
jgi:hypothetical protein